MKKLFTRPGFEAIFAFSVFAIFCLPLLVFAQEKQEKRRLEIKINNGDTIINGKNIKDLSGAERQQALKDINGFRDTFTISGSDHQRFFIRRKKSDTGSQVFIEKRLGDGELAFDIKGDTSKHVFKFRHRGPGGKDSLFSFNYRMGPEHFRFENPDGNFDMLRRGRSFGMMRRNSQSFSYTNTGSDGIPTHINFRVMDASPEKTKETTGSEKAGLELKDLSLVPEFSSGKTILMFNLPTKTAADVKFTDSEGKTLWSSKAMNGNFNKSFVLGLNGIYFLQVKQAGKVALKRIVKEE